MMAPQMLQLLGLWVCHDHSVMLSYFRYFPHIAVCVAKSELVFSQKWQWMKDTCPWKLFTLYSTQRADVCFLCKLLKHKFERISLIYWEIYKSYVSQACPWYLS